MFFIASSTLKIKCGKAKGVQEKSVTRDHCSTSSELMSISDPRNRFFYLHHTPIKKVLIISPYRRTSHARPLTCVSFALKGDIPKPPAKD